MVDHQREFAELLDAGADGIVANDPEAIGRFSDPGWVFVGSTGIVEGARFLEEVAAGRVTHSWMAFDVHRVRVEDEVAIVTAPGRNGGEFRGEPFALHEWTTDVFVHRDGGRRCALTDPTEVGGSREPGEEAGR